MELRDGTLSQFELILKTYHYIDEQYHAYDSILSVTSIIVAHDLQTDVELPAVMRAPAVAAVELLINDTLATSHTNRRFGYGLVKDDDGMYCDIKQGLFKLPKHLLVLSDKTCVPLYQHDAASHLKLSTTPQYTTAETEFSYTIRLLRHVNGKSPSCMPQKQKRLIERTVECPHFARKLCRAFHILDERDLRAAKMTMTQLHNLCEKKQIQDQLPLMPSYMELIRALEYRVFKNEID